MEYFLLQGRTFSGLIHSHVATHGPLNTVYLPLYETPDGRKAYDSTLAAVKDGFPQYVRELEGTADGAQVPFHKVTYTSIICHSEIPSHRGNTSFLGWKVQGTG